MENKVVPRRSRPERGCKKHTKHQQSPGVCSICLREKLSQLNNIPKKGSTTRASASSCSSSSSLSSLSSQESSNASSYSSSPLHRNMRITSTYGRGGRKMLFTKSKSSAFVPGQQEQAASDDHRKKKGGFWSKLLRPKSKTNDVELFRFSRTMRELATTKVH